MSHGERETISRRAGLPGLVARAQLRRSERRRKGIYPYSAPRRRPGYVKQFVAGGACLMLALMMALPLGAMASQLYDYAAGLNDGLVQPYGPEGMQAQWTYHGTPAPPLTELYDLNDGSDSSYLSFEPGTYTLGLDIEAAVAYPTVLRPCTMSALEIWTQGPAFDIQLYEQTGGTRDDPTMQPWGTFHVASASGWTETYVQLFGSPTSCRWRMIAYGSITSTVYISEVHLLGWEYGSEATPNPSLNPHAVEIGAGSCSQELYWAQCHNPVTFGTSGGGRKAYPGDLVLVQYKVHQGDPDVAPTDESAQTNCSAQYWNGDYCYFLGWSASADMDAELPAASQSMGAPGYWSGVDQSALCYDFRQMTYPFTGDCQSGAVMRWRNTGAYWAVVRRRGASEGGSDAGWVPLYLTGYFGCPAGDECKGAKFNVAVYDFGSWDGRDPYTLSYPTPGGGEPCPWCLPGSSLSPRWSYPAMTLGPYGPGGAVPGCMIMPLSQKCKKPAVAYIPPQTCGTVVDIGNLPGTFDTLMCNVGNALLNVINAGIWGVDAGIDLIVPAGDISESEPVRRLSSAIGGIGANMGATTRVDDQAVPHQVVMVVAGATIGIDFQGTLEAAVAQVEPYRPMFALVVALVGGIMCVRGLLAFLEWNRVFLL